MTAARALALLRIGLGLEFAIWAWVKTQDGWLTSGSALEDLLGRYPAQAEPAYAQLLEMYVLPNVDIFSRLVTLGEWTAAVALTFGFFTRFGSLVGMWLTVNFMLMRGLFDVSGSIDHVFFLGCLVCLIAAAGNVWGLDGLLRDPEQKSGQVKPRPVANTWANPRAAFSTMRPSPRTAPYTTTYAPQ